MKCLPHSKSLPAKINTCNQYIAAELKALKQGSVMLALGNLAHAAVLKAFGLKLKDYKFAHAARHALKATTAAVTTRKRNDSLKRCFMKCLLKLLGN